MFDAGFWRVQAAFKSPPGPRRYKGHFVMPAPAASNASDFVCEICQRITNERIRLLTRLMSPYLSNFQKEMMLEQWEAIEAEYLAEKPLQEIAESRGLGRMQLAALISNRRKTGLWHAPKRLK
jgi:hypothetical protein